MALNRGRMRVSFDLDEVLFVNPATYKTEPAPHFPFNHIYKERLRAGTPQLIKKLQNLGFEVWVYTTSFRKEKYIRGLFRCYGVKFNGIVNGERHQREVQRDKTEKMPTKLPNRYQISLHIDDESIVCTYGREYGFDVYQLYEEDDEWQEKIIDRAMKVKTRLENR